MSVAASPQPPATGAAGGASPTPEGISGLPAAGGAGVAPPPPLREACPLCAAPLQPEQEWCLRCGAAARTRLSASPNWRAPIVVVALLTALSLGVLAAALVKLAGSEGGAGTPTTTTVTTAPAAAAPPATATTPRVAAPGATTPGARTPGLSTLGKSTPNVTRPLGKPPQSAAPGASSKAGAGGILGLLHLRAPKGKATPAPSRAAEERIRRLINPAAK